MSQPSCIADGCTLGAEYDAPAPPPDAHSAAELERFAAARADGRAHWCVRHWLDWWYDGYGEREVRSAIDDVRIGDMSHDETDDFLEWKYGATT